MTATAMVKKTACFFKAMGLQSVLDYGAGNLRNSLYLLNRGFRVFAVNTQDLLNRFVSVEEQLEGVYNPEAIAACHLGVDAVISNFVLNIIEGQAQTKAVQNIYNNLKKGGYFLAEVRPSFTLEHLDNLVLPVGFKRLQVFRREKSLAVLYSKG